MSKRAVVCGVMAVMAWASVWAEPVGQIKSEFSVRNTGHGFYAEVTVSGETPFLVDPDLKILYAHPDATGSVRYAYGDMATFSDESWRFDGVSFSHGDSEGGSVSPFQTTVWCLFRFSWYNSWVFPPRPEEEFWNKYSIHTTLPILMPTLTLDAKTKDGTLVRLYTAPLDEVTDHYDFLNHSYRFNLGKGTGDNRLFSSGLQVQLSIHGSRLLYQTSWLTADSDGNVEFQLGTGCQSAPIFLTAPVEYYRVTVQPLQEGSTWYSNWYLPQDVQYDGSYGSFEGKVTIQAEDVCGNPVPSYVQLRGGPIGGGGAGYTDAAGQIEFIQGFGGGSGSSAQFSIRVLPKLWIYSDVAQVIDNPVNFIGRRSAFLHGCVTIPALSYTFKTTDTISGATLKLYKNDAVDKTSTTVRIKRLAAFTEAEKRTGRDRFTFEVPVDETPATYRAEVCMKDEAGEERVVGQAEWGPIQATVKPKDDRTLHFQYVPIYPQTSASGTGGWETYVDQILPAQVTYSTAPPLKPDLWPWEADVVRLMGWYRELERYRVSQSPPPDLMVGVVAPGALHTYRLGAAAGLSMDGYKHVVLLDSGAAKAHHLLHEYLHTLGLADNYGGTLAPPSESGYSPQGFRVWNAPNKDPLYCAIMFDFAPNAWPTFQEYQTMIGTLTEPTTFAAMPAMMRAAAEPAQIEPAEYDPASSGKVLLLSGIAEYGAYNETIRNRCPIFVDEGPTYAPQAITSGNVGYGVRTLAGTTAVGTAYQSLSATINGAYLNFGGIFGTISFALPWRADIKAVQFGVFNTSGTMTKTMYNGRVDFSATAPTAQWTAVPPAASTLSGQTTFTFAASDADPDSSLWAWVKISADNGQTWQPMGTYFKLNAAQTAFTLDCSQWPTSPHCRVKLLVTDDGNTTVLQAGPYALEGYTLPPTIAAEPASAALPFAADRAVVIPITLRNEGRQRLTVDVLTADLPAWLRPETTGRMHLSGQSRQTLFFIAEPNTAEIYSAAITLATNDPQRPTLTIPVTLTPAAQPPAPQVCLAQTAGGQTDGETAPMTSSITVLVRDRYGCDTLEAFATAVKLSDGVAMLADKVRMDNTGRRGEYMCTIPLAASLAGHKIGFEFDLADPSTGLADIDGLRSGDWDVTVQLLKPNTPPRFTQVTPLQGAYDYLSIGSGQTINLSYAVEDSEGDPVSYMLHSDLPFEWTMQAGTLRCVLPILDDIWNTAVRRQTIDLVAVDRHGAQSMVQWKLDINPNTYINNRAYPYYSDTVLTGDSVTLKAFSYSALQGQFCRFEYRPQGTSVWTRIADQAYDQEHPGIYWEGRMAATAWTVSGLAPGQAVEVRYTDFWPTGNPDSAPITVVFRKAMEDAHITGLTAAQPLAAGQPFELRVEVENRSANRWTLGDGYGLICPQGVDALTGLERIDAPLGFTQVAPGGRVVFAVQAIAPTQPGTYTTQWQVTRPDGGPLGAPAGLDVRVMPSQWPGLPGDINADGLVNLQDLAALCATWGLTAQDAEWEPACDLAANGQIDLADIIELTAYWMEQR